MIRFLLVLLAAAVTATPSPTPSPAPSPQPSPTRTPNAVTVVAPPPSSSSSLSQYADRIKLNRTPGTSVVISGGGTPQPPEESPTGVSGDAIDRRLLIENERLAREYCAEKWESNWHMRNYCFNDELGSSRILAKRIPPPGVSLDVFHGIRAACADKWPNSFHMWNYCEKDQIESYLKLQQPAP